MMRHAQGTGYGALGSANARHGAQARHGGQASYRAWVTVPALAPEPVDDIATMELARQ
jgi:hypothetical protein